MDQDMFSPNSEFQANWNMLQNQGLPGIDPSHVWHGSNLKPNGLDMGVSVDSRSAARSHIVSSRDGVTEQFGQITPPEEDRRDSFSNKSPKDGSDSKRKFQEEDIAKQNRTQRARNAANKRHSQPKSAKQDSSQDPESDVGEGETMTTKSSNVQREKNRLAAAKCRAKKKATSEEMQESHREGSKENSYLLREMRELRDQKAFLRNSLLQHEPGVCQCHAIHRFNFAQAQQLAMGVGALIGTQPLSPSTESMASAITPGSDASMNSRIGAAANNGVSRRPSLPTSLQTFNNGSSLNINLGNRPEPYPMPMPASEQLIQARFSEYIRSSPEGGRGGFS